MKKAQLLEELFRQKQLMGLIVEDKNPFTPWGIIRTVIKNAEGADKSVARYFSGELAYKLEKAEIKTLDDLDDLITGGRRDIPIGSEVRVSTLGLKNGIGSLDAKAVENELITNIFRNPDEAWLAESIVVDYFKSKQNKKLANFVEELVKSVDVNNSNDAIQSYLKKVRTSIKGVFGEGHPITEWFNRYTKPNRDGMNMTKPAKPTEQIVEFPKLDAETNKNIEDLSNGTINGGTPDEATIAKIKAEQETAAREAQEKINKSWDEVKNKLCANPTYTKLCADMDSVITSAMERMKADNQSMTDPIQMLQKTKKMLEDLKSVIPEVKNDPGFWQKVWDFEKMLFSASYKLEKNESGQLVPRVAVKKTAYKWTGGVALNITTLLIISSVITFIYYLLTNIKEKGWNVALGIGLSKMTLSVVMGILKGAFSNEDMPDPKEAGQLLTGKQITKVDAISMLEKDGFVKPYIFGEIDNNGVFTQINPKDKDNTFTIKDADGDHCLVKYDKNVDKFVLKPYCQRSDTDKKLVDCDEVD